MALVKQGESLKDIMNTHILPCAKASDYEFWVKTAMEVLERHPENMPRARVFSHALWGLSNDTEWDQLEPWIQSSLSPKLWSEISPLFAGKGTPKTTAPPAQGDSDEVWRDTV